MFDIVESPETKRLYLVGEVVIGQKTHHCIAFDGSPLLIDITGWKVIAKAPSAEDWIAEPGNYRTYYGMMSIVIINGNDKTTFVLGDNISYLLNWIEDAKKVNEAVSYQWIAAFSCRNKARFSLKSMALKRIFRLIRLTSK